MLPQCGCRRRRLKLKNEIGVGSHGLSRTQGMSRNRPPRKGAAFRIGFHILYNCIRTGAFHPPKVQTIKFNVNPGLMTNQSCMIGLVAASSLAAQPLQTPQ